MLFDPKWEVQTNRPSLAGLIIWLEQQDPEQKYNFGDPYRCVLGQYARSVGRVPQHCIQDAARILNIQFSWQFHAVVFHDPHTFGAALKRARALAE
jgi:hypothetical protein